MVPRHPNPEVPCRICGYHYRVKPHMVATDRGWQCENRAKCNGNLARQARYRRPT